MSDADAMVAGDVAMLDHEVTPVLEALRANGLNAVAVSGRGWAVVARANESGTGVPAEFGAPPPRAALPSKVPRIADPSLRQEVQ